MRISDWSSDVCSSDLVEPGNAEALQEGVGGGIGAGKGGGVGECRGTRLGGAADLHRDDRLAQRAHLGGQGLERPQGIEALAIGRASCRARVCLYGLISVVPGFLKKKYKQRNQS